MQQQLYIEDQESLIEDINMSVTMNEVAGAVSHDIEKMVEKVAKYRDDVVKLTNHIKQLNLTLLSKNKLIMNLQDKVSDKKKTILANEIKANIAQKYLMS